MNKQIALFVLFTSFFGIPFSLVAKTFNQEATVAVREAISSLTQTPLRQLRENAATTLSGTIQRIVGDEFILNDGTGEVLVDADELRLGQLNLQVGDKVTVTGKMDDGEFDAFSITQNSGNVVRASTSSLTQTPLRQLRENAATTLSGTIQRVVGDEFILNDGTGEILVDADELRLGQLNLQVGDKVTVVGEMDDGEFDAFSITQNSGNVVRASTSSLTQTPLRQLRENREKTITGTVKSLVGNDFILQDGTGEVIVDAGPRWWRAIDLNVGERVTVVGEMDDGEFDAFSITRDDGNTLQIRPTEGPPPWAGQRERR